MTRLMSIFALVVAIVALSAPSVSLGMGVTGPVWSVGETQVSKAAPAKVLSCKSLGGKRVLPCHPDLGVITGPLPVAEPPTDYRPGRNAGLPPLAAQAPEAELPPPRHG